MLYESILPMVFTAIIGYLMGSISFSIIVGKLFEKVDVREHGSGNAGTTNTLRVLGKKAAIIVLLGDILKCLIAVVVGYFLFSETGMWIGGVACMIGHVYPVFFGFKGGKGVATGIAMMTFSCFFAGISSFIIFLIVLFFSRIVSLSSLSAFLVFPIFVYIFTKNMIFVFIAIAMCAFVFYLHRENIKRILSGNEKKISFKN